MNNGKQKGNTRRMTGLAIFTAIIVVLQVLCTFVRFGPFSITLALAPIIIATAIYGKGAGAYLGGVFGLVVLITGLLGWDGGTVMLPAADAPRIGVPLFGSGVRAGFPSPADDYVDVVLDLNSYMVDDAPSTFMVRANGDSMTGAHIFIQRCESLISQKI